MCGNKQNGLNKVPEHMELVRQVQKTIVLYCEVKRDIFQEILPFTFCDVNDFLDIAQLESSGKMANGRLSLGQNKTKKISVKNVNTYSILIVKLCKAHKCAFKR